MFPYLGEQVRNARDTSRHANRKRRNKQITLPTQRRKLARGDLRCQPRDLANDTTRQLHTRDIRVLAQRLQHIRVNLQPAHNRRQIVNDDRHRTAVCNVLEELHNGRLRHRPVEHRRDQHQREVRAVLVARGGLRENLARAACPAAERDGDIWPPCCGCDGAAAFYELGFFIEAEGAGLARGAGEDDCRFQSY